MIYFFIVKSAFSQYLERVYSENKKVVHTFIIIAVLPWYIIYNKLLYSKFLNSYNLLNILHYCEYLLINDGLVRQT